MILLNDFYSVISQKVDGDQIEAAIVLHKGHRIFLGHFPGHPIVPGVCMMQIVREIAEFSFNSKFRIKGADQIKFLTMLDPTQHNSVSVSINAKNISQAEIPVQASMFSGEIVFFKMKATFHKT